MILDPTEREIPLDPLMVETLLMKINDEFLMMSSMVRILLQRERVHLRILMKNFLSCLMYKSFNFEIGPMWFLEMARGFHQLLANYFLNEDLLS